MDYATGLFGTFQTPNATSRPVTNVMIPDVEVKSAAVTAGTTTATTGKIDATRNFWTLDSCENKMLPLGSSYAIPKKRRLTSTAMYTNSAVSNEIAILPPRV